MAAEPQSNSESDFMSSINVTPFVDVVLVLLVIFMVTAPILVKDAIGLKLPKTESGDGKTLQTLGVAVNRQGQFLVNGTLTTDEALKTQAQEALRADPEAQAIISADTDVPYGRVVKAIDLIKSVGLNRFAIQVERENP
ncbi:MAG: ExbD/TolR family protein [Bdellovibrionales bacterium]